MQKQKKGGSSQAFDSCWEAEVTIGAITFLNQMHHSGITYFQKSLFLFIFTNKNLKET